GLEPPARVGAARAELDPAQAPSVAGVEPGAVGREGARARAGDLKGDLALAGRLAAHVPGRIRRAAARDQDRRRSDQEAEQHGLHSSQPSRRSFFTRSYAIHTNRPRPAAETIATQGLRRRCSASAPTRVASEANRNSVPLVPSMIAPSVVSRG